MLKTILAQKKKIILNRWLQLIVDSHPAGSRLLVDKDQFTNPVGNILSSEIEVLFDELLSGHIDSEKTNASLDAIIRIRAVQDFSPGEAVSFVFLIKDAIRDELKNQIKEKDVASELVNFENVIDNLACQAFNVYTDCRDRVNTIRINEIKRDRDNAQRLLERFLKKYGDSIENVAVGYNGSEVT